MTHWFIIRVEDEANFRAAWGVVSPDERLGRWVMGANLQTMMTGSSRISPENAQRLGRYAKVFTEFPSEWSQRGIDEEEDDSRVERRSKLTEWFLRTFTSTPEGETVDGRS